MTTFYLALYGRRVRKISLRDDTFWHFVELTVDTSVVTQRVAMYAVTWLTDDA